MEGEQELYRKNPSMFRNHPLLYLFNLAIIGAGAGLLITNVWLALSVFGFGIAILLIWWINAISTTLIVTDKRTILRKGILSKYTNEVFHVSVRNIEITQGIIQRIFNVGDIVIASSSGQADLEIAVRGIPEPETVKHLINKYRMTSKSIED